MTITDAQLDELLALCDRATPAPWSPESRCSDVNNSDPSIEDPCGLGWEIPEIPEPQLRGQFQKGYDAHLICSTRNRLAALISRARDANRLEAENVRLRKLSYHTTLRELFGAIKDSGSKESDLLWAHVVHYMDARTEALMQPEWVLSAQPEPSKEGS